MTPRTRRLAALGALLALLVAVLVLPAAGPATAAGTVPTTVRGWTTEPLALPAGRAVRTVLRVRTGQRWRARRVVLQFRPTGGRWTAVDARRTTPRGRVALTTQVRRTGALRVRVPATRTARAATTRARAVRVVRSAGVASRSDRFEGSLLALVNQLRAEGTTCGGRAVPPRPAVGRHPLLDRASGDYAARMAEAGFFAHRDPGTAEDPGDRADAVGYDWDRIGEDLAGGHDTPAEVVAAWRESREHCAVLMGEWEHAGVGFAERAGSHLGTYWVLMVGDPDD